jgi:hypothetical protein
MVVPAFQRRVDFAAEKILKNSSTQFTKSSEKSCRVSFQANQAST